MTLGLRGELARHRAQRVRDQFPMGPTDHFFGTISGGRRDPDRFRDRVLGRAVTRANEKRVKQGSRCCRRSRLTRCGAPGQCWPPRPGRDPHWISDQIGHTSASFTLQVYQQTRNRRLSDTERQAIWELMRFADEPADCPFTRQLTRSADGESRPIHGPWPILASEGPLEAAAHGEQK
jgi:hypothetical protein